MPVKPPRVKNDILTRLNRKKKKEKKSYKPPPTREGKGEREKRLSISQQPHATP
jgi:hypothetical protein